MEIPVLSVEQKLAIREAQLKILSLQTTIKDLQQRLQTANQELMTHIAAASGDLGEEYSFNLDTLTFVLKPKE